MKLYISGPMTGYEDLNRPAFRDAQITLESLGHDVFNPGNSPPNRTRRKYLEYDLGWICRQAEGMVMLFNWVRSSGAGAELATAKALGIPVWYQCATVRDEFMSYDPFDAKGGPLYLGRAV